MSALVKIGLHVFYGLFALSLVGHAIGLLVLIWTSDWTDDWHLCGTLSAISIAGAVQWWRWAGPSALLPYLSLR